MIPAARRVTGSGGSRSRRRGRRGRAAPRRALRCGRPARRRDRGRRRAASPRARAPDRSSAISKRRGSGFSTPSSCESSITSKRRARSRRSNSTFSFPFAFDTTTSFTPIARSRSSTSGTPSGTVSHRLCVEWYACRSSSARSVAADCAIAAVLEHEVEVRPSALAVARRRLMPEVDVAARERIGGLERGGGDAHAVRAERVAHPLPVWRHQHAARVEKQGGQRHASGYQAASNSASTGPWSLVPTSRNAGQRKARAASGALART